MCLEHSPKFLLLSSEKFKHIKRKSLHIKDIALFKSLACFTDKDSNCISGSTTTCISTEYTDHISVATGIQETLLQWCQITNMTERTGREKLMSENECNSMQFGVHTWKSTIRTKTKIVRFILKRHLPRLSFAFL